MALNREQITNMALSLFGDYLIDYYGDKSKQDIYTTLHWDTVRDSLLEEYVWNFATKRVQISLAAGTSPSYGYDYSYTLPTDCVRVLEMVSGTSPENDTSDSYDYKIEEGYLNTNESDPVYIKYTSQITGTSTWPATFREAFIYKLGSMVAPALGAVDANMQVNLSNGYENAIAKAKGIDFEEGQNETEGYYAMINCRDN